MRTHEGLFFFFLKRLLSLARPPDDLESLFHSPYSFCKVKLVSVDNLWHHTYPLRLLLHKTHTESFHYSRLAALVRPMHDSHPPFLYFLFQPCASRWSLVFLFFCFLLVPKSFLCCSRCFGSVLVYVRSSLIYAVSPLYSEVSCPFLIVALQY